jgi:hypothetical protein
MECVSINGIRLEVKCPFSLFHKQMFCEGHGLLHGFIIFSQWHWQSVTCPGQIWLSSVKQISYLTRRDNHREIIGRTKSQKELCMTIYTRSMPAVSNHRYCFCVATVPFWEHFLFRMACSTGVRVAVLCILIIGPICMKLGMNVIPLQVTSS